jgi:5-methylcytosine-specific restriction endonuclease McrA
MRKGLVVPAVEVHHITELTPDNINDPSVSLNLDNLVSLCKDCHADRHRARQMRYRILSDGSVVAR